MARPATLWSLRAKQGCTLNCFGIQPTFVENNKIPQSFFTYIYRSVNHANKGGRMNYMMRYKLGEDNNDILQNCFHINDCDRHVVKTIMQNSFTFKHEVPINELLKNDKLLTQTLLYYMERIHYYVCLGPGNFLITSRQDLYNKKLLTTYDVKDFTVYLVEESILPKNVLILGRKHTDALATPIVASPLIDKVKFDKLKELNGITDELFSFNPELKYPMMDKYIKIYDLCQSYMDNIDVPYWYIQKFKNPTAGRQKAHYITLYFD